MKQKTTAQEIADIFDNDQSGEGYDDGQRECLGFFEIPPGVEVEWIQEPREFLGRAETEHVSLYTRRRGQPPMAQTTPNSKGKRK